MSTHPQAYDSGSKFKCPTHWIHIQTAHNWFLSKHPNNLGSYPNTQQLWSMSKHHNWLLPKCPQNLGPCLNTSTATFSWSKYPISDSSHNILNDSPVCQVLLKHTLVKCKQVYFICPPPLQNRGWKIEVGLKLVKTFQHQKRYWMLILIFLIKTM